MKMKYVVAVCIFIMLLTGCIRYHSERVHHGRISVTVKETDHQFRLDAKFKRSHTNNVARIIREELDHTSLTDEDLRGTITIQDDDHVYVRLRNGRLKIRFNKDQNDEAAYARVKRLADHIKIAVTSEQVLR